MAMSRGAAVPSTSPTPTPEKRSLECLEELFAAFNINKCPDDTESGSQNVQRQRLWYPKVFISDTQQDTGKEQNPQPSTSEMKLTAKCGNRISQDELDMQRQYRYRKWKTRKSGRFGNLTDSFDSLKFLYEPSKRPTTTVKPKKSFKPQLSRKEYHLGNAPGISGSPKRTSYWKESHRSSGRAAKAEKPMPDQLRRNFQMCERAETQVSDLRDIHSEYYGNEDERSHRHGRRRHLENVERLDATSTRCGGQIQSNVGASEHPYHHTIPSFTRGRGRGGGNKYADVRGRQLAHGAVGGPSLAARPTHEFFGTSEMHGPVFGRTFQYGEVRGVQWRDSSDLEERATHTRSMKQGVGEPTRQCEPVREWFEMREGGNRRGRGRRGRGRGRQE